MEFKREEPSPAELQIINHLVGEGFIPPIEPALPIDVLIENNMQTIYMLDSIADYCQRQLVRVEDHEGYMLSKMQAAEIITYQRSIQSEIERLHSIEERLNVTDRILQLASGEPSPVNVQVMVEGSPLLTEPERSMLRSVLENEPVCYELSSLDDINFAAQVLEYQMQANHTEAVQYGSQTRVELATILTNAFGSHYEIIEGFRDLCSMARNIYIRRNIPDETQLVALLVGPFRKAAAQLGISAQLTQNTLAQLNYEAATMPTELTGCTDNNLDTGDGIGDQIEGYLAEAAAYQENYEPYIEGEQAYHEFVIASRVEYLQRFKEWGMIPHDSSGNVLSHEESNRMYDEVHNALMMARIDCVAAGVAWVEASQYGKTAIQMFGFDNIVARWIRYTRAFEYLCETEQAIRALRRSEEIHYFIDKFIFLDAGTGISEHFHFSDADTKSVSYDCVEMLSRILEAPEFSEAEIRQLYDYFSERYEGYYSLAEDAEELERRGQLAEQEANRTEHDDRLRNERRNRIDTVLAANYHDRFSEHDDWIIFVRRLHQYADILNMGGAEEMIDHMWQSVNKIANRLGIDEIELDRIQKLVLDVE